MSEPTQQFPQQPYGPQQPTGLPPAPVATKPKRFGWIALALAAAAGLLLGSCAGAVGGAASAGKAPAVSASPAPTVTVTRTETAPAVEPSAAETSAEDPPSYNPTYTPKASDFTIGIKTLSKECFGSAGCNVTFRINPSYSGDPLPTSGETEVTYRVTGLTDPVESTFTIDSGGTAHFEKEQIGQTESAGAKLGVKVLDASWSE